MHICDITLATPLPPPFLIITKGLRSLDHHSFLVVWEGTARASDLETFTELTATGNNCENLRTL